MGRMVEIIIKALIQMQLEVKMVERMEGRSVWGAFHFYYNVQDLISCCVAIAII